MVECLTSCVHDICPYALRFSFLPAGAPAPQIVVIESSSPEVIYVPTYNPTVVYGAWPYPAYPPYYYYPPGYAAGPPLPVRPGALKRALPQSLASD